MMESIVGSIWSSRRLSRTGWAILNRAREEVQTLPLFLSPPHSWFNAGYRGAERSLVASFLQDLLNDIEVATRFYSQAPGEYDDDGELAERVLWALVLMQSERLPGMHQTCLLCPSNELQNHMRWMEEDSPRVSIERRHESSGGYWALNEISILPSSRDVDYQVPLCWSHEVDFSLALEAVLGFVGLPADA